MYGKIRFGKIEYAPKNYRTPKGEVIINFDKNKDVMKKYGFKEVEDIRPAYNPEYQELIQDGYDISDTKIKVKYIVIDKPAMLSRMVDGPSLEERIANLELAIEDLTRKLNEE